MIGSRDNFIKKKEKRHTKGDAHKLQYLRSTKREDVAEQSMIIVIPEYQFPHGIFKIASSEMNSNGLKYAFDKLSTFLGLKNKPDIGLTIIVSPQWMFVASINQ
jgi:hypothetical protein